MAHIGKETALRVHRRNQLCFLLLIFPALILIQIDLNIQKYTDKCSCYGCTDNNTYISHLL